jgi:signal transduction histidine kinase
VTANGDDVRSGDADCAVTLASRAESSPGDVTSAALRHRDNEIGQLFVADPRGRNFDALDERLVRMLAQRAAAAIETVRSLEREAQQRAWLQAVLDNMPECVIIADAGGSLLANDVARAMSVSAPDEPPRFDLRGVDGKAVADRDLPIARALRGEAVADVELVLHAHDRVVPMLVNAAPVVDAHGERIGAVCLCRDVTSLRALEKLREEWAAVIAHDLRQPLSVIRVSDEVLAKNASGQNTSSSRAIERIRVATRRMWTMIEELVDTSLIEANRLKVVKTPTSIAACVHEVIEQMAEQLEGRDVIVDAAEDTVVPADEARIVQVIGNLLSNAAKYGAPGTPIRVAIRPEEQVLRVVVENHGKEIAQSELQRMFSRFFRTGAATSSAARGLGLGLYIAQGLVHGHGGDIVATSEGGLTRFEITLPR